MNETLKGFLVTFFVVTITVWWSRSGGLSFFGFYGLPIASFLLLVLMPTWQMMIGSLVFFGFSLLAFVGYDVYVDKFINHQHMDMDSVNDALVLAHFMSVAIGVGAGCFVRAIAHAAWSWLRKHNKSL